MYNEAGGSKWNAFFVLLAWLFLWPHAVGGETINVSSDSGDYTSIQMAIDHAAPGDIILVSDGGQPEKLRRDIRQLEMLQRSQGMCPPDHLTEVPKRVDLGVDLAPDEALRDDDIEHKQGKRSKYQETRPRNQAGACQQCRCGGERGEEHAVPRLRRALAPE